MIAIQTRIIPATNTKPTRIVCEVLGDKSRATPRRYYSASPGGEDRTLRQAAEKYAGESFTPPMSIVLGCESGDVSGHYFAKRVTQPRPDAVKVESFDLVDGDLNWNTLRTKETTESLTLTVFHNGKVDTAASVEILMGRGSNASRVYAIARFYTPRESTQPDAKRFGIGSGHAGGYGYCKSSAAAQAAMRAAGVKLDQHIGGTGMGSVREALIAWGHAAGWSMAGHSI